MKDYTKTCPNGSCGKFKIIVKSDGSFSVDGISIEDFNKMFPNFSPSIDENGNIEVNNFYNSNATSDIENPTQMTMDVFVTAENVITLSPVRSAQITSWERSNLNGYDGLVSPIVDNDAELTENDYPTLSDVLRSMDDEDRNGIRMLSYKTMDSFKGQVAEAISDGLLPSLYMIALTDLNNISSDIPLLFDYISELSEFGDLRVGASIQQFSDQKLIDGYYRPVFEYKDGVVDLVITPPQFNFIGHENICEYVVSLFESARNCYPDATIALDFRDAGSISEFIDMISSDDEPRYTVLGTLLHLLDCGFTPTGKYIIGTDYGYYDSSTGNWISNNGYYAISDVDDEYGIGVVSAVAQIVDGMEWNGADVDNDKIQAIMTAARLVSQDLIYGTPPKDQPGVIVDNNSLTLHDELELSDVLHENGFLSYLAFANGSMDVIVSLENNDADTVDSVAASSGDTRFVMLSGISKTAGVKYMTRVTGSVPRVRFEKISLCRYTEEMLGDISIIDVDIDLRCGSLYEAAELIRKGASSVTYSYMLNSVTVTHDSYTTEGFAEDEAPIYFPNISSKYFSLGDRISVLTSGDMEVPRAAIVALENRVVDTVDCTGMPVYDKVLEEIDYIVGRFGSSVEIKVTEEVFRRLYLYHEVYGLGYNISCGVDIDTIADKRPTYYYSFKVFNGEIEKTPARGFEYIDGTLPRRIGDGHLSVLNFVKNDFCGGTTEMFKEFVDTGARVTSGVYFPYEFGTEYYIAAAIESRYEYVSHDDHKDTVYKASVINVYPYVDLDGIVDEYVPSPSDTYQKVLIATVKISDIGEYTIIPSGVTIKPGTEYEFTYCGVDDEFYLTNTTETEQPIVDMNDGPYVIYTPVANGDGSVSVTYTAFDENGNDITDQFNTLTLGETFIHKEIN